MLFVAGASYANAPAGRYTSANGTVYDTKTKLTWEQATSPTKLSWGSASTAGTAQSYCATSGTGWRLPTLVELQSLVDYSQAGGTTATIDPVFFPNTPATPFWSSTSTASSSAWAVDFSTGDTGDAPPGDGYDVRCVR